MLLSETLSGKQNKLINKNYITVLSCRKFHAFLTMDTILVNLECAQTIRLTMTAFLTASFDIVGVSE